MVVGGAGSGKSACVAIPTLRDFWEGRFLAVDIKGELAQKSGRRACIFNPIQPEAFGYDPFYSARKSDNVISPLRDIALSIVPTPPGLKDPFWVQSAQNILTGHLLASFNQGDSFMEAMESLQSVPIQTLLEVDCEDEQARRYLVQHTGAKPETLASIKMELSNHIMPFATDPQLQTALSARNSITPDLLEEGKDIFLQVPESKIEQWKALVTLILQQFLRHFEQRPEGNETPILFLLDEFARFGKLEGILHGLATLRSKKITICILVQSLAQLDAIYGADQRKIIADNCSYKAILSATDADTQRYFSSLVGMEERKQYHYDRYGGTSSYSMVDKAIVKPEEFAYLGAYLVLLTPSGYGKVRKVYC